MSFVTNTSTLAFLSNPQVYIRIIILTNLDLRFRYALMNLSGTCVVIPHIMVSQPLVSHPLFDLVQSGTFTINFVPLLIPMLISLILSIRFEKGAISYQLC